MCFGEVTQQGVVFRWTTSHTAQTRFMFAILVLRTLLYEEKLAISQDIEPDIDCIIANIAVIARGLTGLW